MSLLRKGEDEVQCLMETEMQVDRTRVWEDTRTIYHPKPYASLDLLSSCFFKS